MQDLVSERDQSWVTGDAILHTLIIPQFGKNTTCVACIIQSAAIRQISLCCQICYVWCNHCELLSLSKDNKPHRWHNG